jgi:hypothetical protein
VSVCEACTDSCEWVRVGGVSVCEACTDSCVWVREHAHTRASSGECKCVQMHPLNSSVEYIRCMHPLNASVRRNGAIDGAKDEC